MTLHELVLLVANVVYATAFVALRVALDDVPPATLALGRLGLAALALGALGLLRPRPRGATRGGARFPRPDARRVLAMGVLGFDAAYALSHWGLAASSVTHAALLIVLEPIAIILLAPLVLREGLTPREGAGAALAILGAVLVIANGVPGLDGALFPTWRGDLLLVLAAGAYAAYSLIGRSVLARHRALPVTLASIGWGALAILPLATAEWVQGARPRVTTAAMAATLYLALVITGGGYLAWNWALRRVSAPRAAVFLTVQPVVGAASGVLVRGESPSLFTVLGGLSIVGGLAVTLRAGRPNRATVEAEHAGSAQA